MRITKAEQVQLGNIYMYIKWTHLGKLDIGECVRISKDSIELKPINKNTVYSSTDEIAFIKDRYPTVKYNTILDYDKRIFNAYNEEMKKHGERIEDILDGNIKTRRKSKKKSRLYKLLKKLHLKK